MANTNRQLWKHFSRFFRRRLTVRDKFFLGRGTGQGAPQHFNVVEAPGALLVLQTKTSDNGFVDFYTVFVGTTGIVLVPTAVQQAWVRIFLRFGFGDRTSFWFLLYRAGQRSKSLWSNTMISCSQMQGGSGFSTVHNWWGKRRATGNKNSKQKEGAALHPSTVLNNRIPADVHTNKNSLG